MTGHVRIESIFECIDGGGIVCVGTVTDALGDVAEKVIVENARWQCIKTDVIGSEAEDALSVNCDHFVDVLLRLVRIGRLKSRKTIFEDPIFILGLEFHLYQHVVAVGRHDGS